MNELERAYVAGIGRAVRAQRQHLRITQTAFAESAGVSRSNLAMIESGKYAHSPDLSTLIRISTALGLPVWELLARSIEMPVEHSAEAAE